MGWARPESEGISARLPTALGLALLTLHFTRTQPNPTRSRCSSWRAHQTVEYVGARTKTTGDLMSDEAEFQEAGLNSREWYQILRRLVRDDSNARHMWAAIGLQGHPLGFTWADVDEIRDAARAIESVWSSDESALRSIADRIAALLPPRA